MKFQHTWNKRKNTLPRKECRRSKDSKGRKDKSIKKHIIFHECKELVHYKSECPKLEKRSSKEKDFRGKKKSHIATWDDSHDTFDENEKQANMTSMASVHSDSNDELITMLNEFLNNSHKISSKLKIYKMIYSIIMDAYKILENNFETIKK